MKRERILNYFLEKPGTFDENNEKEIVLNLASKSVVRLRDDSIMLKNQSSQSSSMDKSPWLTYTYDTLEIEQVYELIDQSYNEVMNDLTQEEQDEILDLEW